MPLQVSVNGVIKAACDALLALASGVLLTAIFFAFLIWWIIERDDTLLENARNFKSEVWD